MGTALVRTDVGLIENLFFGDERAAVIAEVAQAFGDDLADRLGPTNPPEHAVLRQRLARTLYVGFYLVFALDARRCPQPAYLDLGPARE